VTGPPSEPIGSPVAKSPRTMRIRNAGILAVASLVVGVGIGAAGTKPGAAEPVASNAAATQASTVTAGPTATLSADDTLSAEPTEGPTLAPTASPTPEPTPEPVKPVVVKGKGSQKT
jgi:hypothetical protein